MNIAFLRANGIGDFIVTLPALEAIKAQFPSSRLILMGRPWHRVFLKGRQSPIDQVVVVPPMPVLFEPKGDEYDGVPDEKHFFNYIHSLNLDVAIQGHGGGRYSNPFIKKLGAKLTIGSRTEDAEELDRNIFYDRYQNEIFRHLELVSLMGAPPITLQPRLTLCDRDIQDANHFIDLREKFAVIQGGAGDPRRRWTVAKFAKVADSLAEKGLKIILNSTPSERELTHTIVRSMKNDATVCENISLHGLFGLVAHAQLVISNDSGPMHLAVAAGTPTIGLFWHGNYTSYAPAHRQRFRALVSWIDGCHDCGGDLRTEGECPHDFSWIESITAEEVLEAAFSLLARPLSQDSRSRGRCNLSDVGGRVRKLEWPLRAENTGHDSPA